MKQFKVGFLINPISGGGQGKVIARFLDEIMRSFAFGDNEWIFEFTQREGMEEQIDRMIEGCEKIIAVGGDGTMSMVMKSLLKQSFRQVQAGLIPLGTGNDLARTLGIYQNYINKGLLNTIRKLISAESHKFDLWSVNNSIDFAAYLSFGVDAKIIHEFDTARKQGKVWGSSALMNKLYYVYVGLKQRHYRIPAGTTIQFIDTFGKETSLDLQGYTSVVISNISSYSGGAHPFKESDYSDGLLEVLPLKGLFHFIVALSCGKIPFFKHLIGKRILPCFHTSRVKVIVGKGNCAQIDGEAVEGELRHSDEIVVSYRGSVKLLSLESL